MQIPLFNQFGKTEIRLAQIRQFSDRKRQPAASAPNEMWSMDFVSYAPFDGRRLRALTVVDAFTREALPIDVEPGIGGEQKGPNDDAHHTDAWAPKTIRVDNVLCREAAGAFGQQISTHRQPSARHAF